MSSSSNHTGSVSSGLDDRALYHRVVVKAGTTLLTRGGDRLNLQVMATLVEQVARLRQEGTEIILVTSGAVAAGRHVLGAPREGRGVPFRQVLAAAGQGRLMHAYEQLFDWHQTPVAQALLSRKDLTERQGYLNVRNTLTQLMDLGVVPIVNENDVVAVDELAGEFFGDNDNLSAMVANLVDADLLVILGQTEGLFTADPHLDPDATLIPLVERVDETIEAAAGGSWQDQGQGGMTTKLEGGQAGHGIGRRYGDRERPRHGRGRQVDQGRANRHLLPCSGLEDGEPQALDAERAFHQGPDSRGTTGPRRCSGAGTSACFPRASRGWTAPSSEATSLPCSTWTGTR